MPAGAADIAGARWRELRDAANPERAAANEGRKARLGTLRMVISHVRAALPKGDKPAVRRVA